MTLEQLAAKFGTDKLSLGYIPFYETWTRRLTVRRVLEIGVWRGYSLRMWEEYFPHADIVGLDYAPGNFNPYGGRIRVFSCDQSSATSLDNVVQMVGTGFDLIVDDGSHKIADQILTAEKLLPLLSPLGAYVVEDVHRDRLAQLLRRFPHSDAHAFGHHEYCLVKLATTSERN